MALYRFAIFVTGATVLALQVISSRVMTPYFGVSLYIWASILSTTLLFLAIGYYLGGVVTRRLATQRIAYLFCLAPSISALSILLANIIYPMLFAALARWNLIGGSFIACLIILAVPLTLLSALNPLLIAMETARPDAPGDGRGDSGAGTVFFISTLGSVLGVLIAAFVMIPNLANSDNLLASSIGLSLVSMLSTVASAGLMRPVKRQLLAVAVVALALNAAHFVVRATDEPDRFSSVKHEHLMWKTIVSKPSAFGNLKVIDLYPGRSTLPARRLLMNDGLVQNGLVMPDGDAAFLVAYALEHLAMGLMPEAESALVLGIGAGIVPGRLAKRGLDVVAVDINPQIVEVARQYFGFDAGSAEIVIEDVRTHVNRCRDRYGVVVIDLISGDGVPEHLVTREFFEDISRCARSDGAVAMNMLYYPANPMPLRSLLRTLAQVFETVGYMVRPAGGVGKLTNVFLLATNGIVPENLHAERVAIPRHLQTVWQETYRSTILADRNSPFVGGGHLITDENNIWSVISTATNTRYRHHVHQYIPSALLAD